MKQILTVMILLTLSPLSALAGDQIQLSFWTSERDKEKIQNIEYIIKAFKAFNPDIEIALTSIDENELQDDFFEAVAEGKGPDIINTGAETVIGIALAGMLNTAAATKTMESIGVDNFYAGARSMLYDTHNNVYFGLPFHGWIQGIWYRADWFEEAGLEPPNTPERILTAAKTLHNPEAGRYGILIGTKPDTYAVQVFTQFMLANGNRILNADGSVALDTPDTIRTLDYYKGLSRYTPPGPQGWRGRDYYIQGKLAMFFYSTFIMDDLALPSVAANSLEGGRFPDLPGASFSPALLPNTKMVSTITGKHSASYGMINALGIGMTTPAKTEAATRFIRFLYQPASYLVWLHMAPGGMLPVIKGISDMTVFHQDLQGVFLHYGRQKLANIISGMDYIMSTSFRDGVLHKETARIIGAGILQKMIADTVQGKDTPAQAVQKAADEIRGVITKYREALLLSSQHSQ